MLTETTSGLCLSRIEKSHKAGDSVKICKQKEFNINAFPKSKTESLPILLKTKPDVSGRQVAGFETAVNEGNLGQVLLS